MCIIAYHGTKTDFTDFASGDLSIDRMVGPHFSKTPAMANLFALKNPGRKGRGKVYGGRVVPVRLEGAVYVVNQRAADFPGAYGHINHPVSRNWLGMFAWDHHAVAYDIGKTVLPAREDLRKRYARLGGFQEDSLLEAFEKANSWALVGAMAVEAADGLMRDLAVAYRELLRARGYVAVQYLNTAKKEQVGDLDDQTCFIALQPPKFLFD